MLINSPIFAFTVLLTVIFTVPPIFERLRLPGLVGLLLAGVILGDNGLHLLNSESDTMKLLSDIGKVYLMFVAGLEIDLKQFRKTRNRSIGFGFLTFIVPLIAGILVGVGFNFSPNASLLIGSLLASHTLLAYPIVSRLGVVNDESVTVTIGATIFTDTGALLVLAICVGIHGGDFTAFTLFTLLLGLALYSAIVLFGFDWAGKEFFRRTGDEQGNQFLFILLALFLAAVGAQIIGVEKIVGAFLAGLAVNDVLGKSPVKEKVEFVGSVLFIPCFFVDMGLLIDLPAFIKTLSSIWLTIAIVVALIGSKFLAALGAKLLYKYNKDQLLTMWSLSLPQVAATLAATLVAYESFNKQGERLIPETVLNSVIVLMLVTSILGPLITTRYAHRLHRGYQDFSEKYVAINHRYDTIIVPIHNPENQRYLLEMASLLVREREGKIFPLIIVKAHVQMDEPELEQTISSAQNQLDSALDMTRELGVSAKPLFRIDDNVAWGISRTAREQNANLILMGWQNNRGLKARLFGNLIDSVFWSSHCQVSVARLLISPLKIKRILVPIKTLDYSHINTVQFAKVWQEILGADVVLFHVSTTTLDINIEREKVFKMKIVYGNQVARAIIQEAREFDMVVLRSSRYRTAGGVGVSEITTNVLKNLNGSIVLLGEPVNST